MGSRARHGRIYCCEGDRSRGWVEVLDAADGHRLQRFTVGAEPTALAFPPAGHETLVACSDAVRFVDDRTGALLGNVNVAARPLRMALSADGQVAVVTSRDSDTVTVIDVPQHRVRGAVMVGRQPIGVSLLPDGSRAYVQCWKDGTVDVIDLRSCTRVGRTAPHPGSGPGIAVQRRGDYPR